MNLTSIEIDNYRSCEHTVLECGSNLTALIGLNAAGKSNILSAIYILGLLGNFQDTRFHADNDGNLHVYLEHDSWKAEVFTNLRKRAEPEMAFLFGDLLNEQIRLPLYFFSKNSDEQFVKARKAFLSELLGNNKDAAFYTTLFTRLDTIQDFFANIRYYPSSFYNDASNMDILVTTDQPNTPSEWFIYNLYVCQFKEKGLYQRYKDLICKNGMNLVDDIIVTLGSPGNNNPHASSLPQATEALNGKYITPLAMTNGKTLLFSQLSAGTYRIMALLFYLIRNDGGLILLEEPENSVHLKLLHDIIEIMENESEHKQVVFSTHSDYALGMLKPQNVVFVENSKKGTTTRSLPKEMSEGMHEGLKAYLENEGNLGDYWKSGGFNEY